MEIPGPFPFVGKVTWLRPDEGGRASGPPPIDPYAQIACVPPADIDSGAASFVLTEFVTGALVSPARGRWLEVENNGQHRVSVGDVVAIHEGRHHVADFKVDAIDQYKSELRPVEGAMAAAHSRTPVSHGSGDR